MNIHPVEVHSVISFYSFLHSFPRGKNIVQVCKSVTCEMHGKDKVNKAIERELGIKFGETTRDNKFTLQHTNCLGMCDEGPAMLVNSNIYTKLDPEKAVLILNEIK
jgi:NADH:ubiquinone oxidoreductase subunit E